MNVADNFKFNFLIHIRNKSLPQIVVIKFNRFHKCIYCVRRRPFSRSGFAEKQKVFNIGCSILIA